MKESTGLFIVFGLPLLALTLFVSCILWSANRKQQRLERFAAAEGITYKYNWEPSPIALPPVVFEWHRWSTTITHARDFLYGPRRGVDVFACNIQVGSGKATDYVLMVAVRGELHDTSGLDLKQWRLISFNEWAFLVPRKPSGGSLSPGKIAALWDAMTVATQTNWPRACDA